VGNECSSHVGQLKRGSHGMKRGRISTQDFTHGKTKPRVRANRQQERHSRELAECEVPSEVRTNRWCRRHLAINRRRFK
jgi:hypothetical protein